MDKICIELSIPYYAYCTIASAAITLFHAYIMCLRQGTRWQRMAKCASQMVEAVMIWFSNFWIGKLLFVNGIMF